MFGRPRCREWTPLATQQLRLRSLIQIVGYNIRPPEGCSAQCSFYITLHHTTMSAPFYTSERISSAHPKWKEIDADITQCMSSSNVVVRIWCHIFQTTPNKYTQEENSNDNLIQTWGVYFSGLRYIGANLTLNFTSECFKSNTLVFQMHGGYFCSYKSLKIDVIPPENEIEHGSLSSSSSNETSTSSKHTLGSKFMKNQILQSRSVSPNRFSRKEQVSKSQSPVERGFKQPLPKMRSLNNLNSIRDKMKLDSNERLTERSGIYEHSPDNAEVKVFTTTDKNCDISRIREDPHIDLSETAESYDLRNESYWTAPKYRYLALNFLKSEIRPSYNAIKLQKLHLLQYSIKKRQEAVQEVKENIYKKSALTDFECLNCDQNDRIKFKSRSQRNLFSPDKCFDAEKSTSQTDLSVRNGRVKEEKPPANGPRLTLKLNDLLSFKSNPSPFQRSEHIRLTKQLEVSRFKRIILTDERDRKLVNIRRLKERYNKLFEENQDVGTELMQDYHTLSRQSEALKEDRQSASALLELAARSHAALSDRRTQLLREILTVFHIEQRSDSQWYICGVPLPVSSDAAGGGGGGGGVGAARGEAAAAALAALATAAAAAVLRLPLRYRLQLMGSATRIVDTNPELANPVIPLFVRGGDVTLFRYGMFLLNKCIAQLMYARGHPPLDMRPTLANLKKLLTQPTNVSDTAKLFGTYKWLDDIECPRTQSLRSLVASERGKYGRQFNRFKQSADGQMQHSLISLRKHSRSVGSYQDEQELSALDASSQPTMCSEPNIYSATPRSNDTSKATQSSSDPDGASISSTDNEKVVFSLGGDDEGSKLVRLSSNNEDELNVKRICSEIEHFCTKTDEGIDIAKHMDDNIDIVQYVERENSVGDDKLSCQCIKEVCESVNCSDVVTDVIIIDSAEVMLEVEGSRELSQEVDDK